MGLASGTWTFTCVTAGLYRFTLQMQNEMTVYDGAFVKAFSVIGGTGTGGVKLNVLQVDPFQIQAPLAATASSISGGSTFYAVLTAGQTITLFPKIIVNGGAGATTGYTTQATVSAEYVGTN